MTFQLQFDSDHPNIDSLKSFVCNCLENHSLTGVYEAEDIILKACNQSIEGEVTPNTVVEIQSAWLKTTCLEIIAQLSRQYANKRNFDVAIQALFDNKNPETQSFWANVARTLRQFRLSGTYEVKEIISEAYNIGIHKIESGTLIEKPVAWMRVTCLNVIREFNRKQKKADNPKLDGEGLTPADEVLSKLILHEDIKALRLALQKLSPDEQTLLHARFILNHSWQEIGESLSSSTAHKLNAGAARQRGFRALQKLRQCYDEVRREV
ncbi:sigma-70 family RNA polymerase sigma factor [Phormidium tenue FACHB-886]|nr:sigma-70 family RNA polymerase sigma factor [Phormidium tenue FACHB-886]